MDWIEPLLGWFGANPLLAGVLLFLVAAAESLVVVGLVVPGAALMFAAGALIGTGHLPFWPMVAWAVAGAIAGDGISFWLGRRYGRALQNLWPLSRHPRLMARGVDYFRRHGGKSVLIGRFIGPVRPVIPAVAGMMAMPALRFLMVNVLSAIAWAPIYLIPGMVFAASLAVAASVTGRLLALVIVSALLAWAAWRLVRLIRRRTALEAIRWHRRWRRGGPGWITVVINPEGGRGKLLWWCGLGLLVVVLAAALLHPEPRGWEQWLILLAALPRPSPLDHLLWWLALLSEPWALAFATLAMLSVLGAAGRFRRALRVALATATAALLALALQPHFAIESPAAATIGEAGYSFPSVEAAIFAALGFSLALTVAPAGHRGRHGRWRILLLAVATVLGVTATRVAFGLQWPLDVFAGGLLGALVAAAMLRRLDAPVRVRSARWLLAFTALALVLGASAQSWRDPPPLVAEAPLPAAGAVCTEGVRLPQRAGLFGIEGRFPGYWRADRDTLIAALERANWREAAPWDLPGALQWLHPRPDPEALPVLAKWHAGRLPPVVFVQPVGSVERVVLRAWPTREAGWLLHVESDYLVSEGLVVVSRSRARGPRALPDTVTEAPAFCPPQSGMPQRGVSD